MKRFISVIVLMTMCTMLAIGCGAKKNTEEDVIRNTDVPIETQQDDVEVFSKDEIGVIDNQITNENVVNFKPYIVSVDRYVEDELGRTVVGYMGADYVELDEESEKLCPNLVNSLNEFNENRKNSFEEYYPRFSEIANTQFERAFEAARFADSEAYAEDMDSSVDYVWLDVMRADNVAMSLLVTSVSHWVEGGDNNVLYMGTTFDSQTGNKLELMDVVVDIDAYKDAVMSELQRKYQNAKLDNVKLEDYQGWVLTPEGMIVYFPLEYVIGIDYSDICVQINIDEHPGIINEKYSIAPDEYVIPFTGDDIFYMDVNGDVKREVVVYSPIRTDDEAGEADFSSYEIYVNGKPCSNFDEDRFYNYQPYYVRKNNKSYIYVYTEGFEQDYIAVNRFELDEPICVAKLPGTPFSAKDVDDSSEEFINRHIAFSNPDMVDGALSFDENICGTYKGEEGDGGEVRYWEISDIDGKYYLDYIGEYDYMAAEIELLDENPYLVGDELRYMVKVYPFSSFAFAGEYQGAGQVMYISYDLSTAIKTISLSADNPFFYDTQKLLSVDGVNMHTIQDKAVKNQSAPEVIGSWRCTVSNDGNEYNLYMQFDEDGRIDIVRKSEGFTPMVYRGIYKLDKNGDAYTGTIEAEAIGMGTQPVAEWNFEFDPVFRSPFKISDDESDNPLVNGAIDMGFERTKPGQSDRYIHVGPWKRTAEVAELFNEYLAVADAEFNYDYSPEFIDDVCYGALQLTNCTSYYMHEIQDNKKGGEIWIEVLRDVLPSVQVTKEWVRYDLSEGNYYDIYDNCLNEN